MKDKSTNQFFFIAAHYFMRAVRDVKEIILLLLLPLGLIVFQILITSGVGGFEAFGYNVFASHAAPAFLLSFQFFNSFFMFIFLYADFGSDRRWRLLAAPCTMRTFILPAFMANWFLNLLLGIVIVAVCALFLNVYWGDVFVLAAVLAIVSLLATFAGALIFVFTRTLSQANAIGYALAFGLMAISGYMVPFGLFGDHAALRFLTRFGTPLTLGTNAIIASGELNNIFADMNVALPGVPIGGGDVSVMFNIGALAAITLAVGLITVMAAKKRKE